MVIPPLVVLVRTWVAVSGLEPKKAQGAVPVPVPFFAQTAEALFNEVVALPVAPARQGAAAIAGAALAPEKAPGEPVPAWDSGTRMWTPPARC